MTPPEFFGQNICGACEGDGAELDLSNIPVVHPLRACRFCGGIGDVRPDAPAETGKEQSDA